MFELQDIFANHLTMMVFTYGSASMLIASGMAALALFSWSHNPKPSAIHGIPSPA
jgi:hypothetical protein